MDAGGKKGHVRLPAFHALIVAYYYRPGCLLYYSFLYRPVAFHVYRFYDGRDLPQILRIYTGVL